MIQLCPNKGLTRLQVSWRCGDWKKTGFSRRWGLTRLQVSWRSWDWKKTGFSRSGDWQGSTYPGGVGTERLVSPGVGTDRAPGIRREYGTARLVAPYFWFINLGMVCSLVLSVFLQFIIFYCNSIIWLYLIKPYSNFIILILLFYFSFVFFWWLVHVLYVVSNIMGVHH